MLFVGPIDMENYGTHRNYASLVRRTMAMEIPSQKMTKRWGTKNEMPCHEVKGKI